VGDGAAVFEQVDGSLRDQCAERIADLAMQRLHLLCRQRHRANGSHESDRHNVYDATGEGGS
jgi:hypothetical protein